VTNYQYHAHKLEGELIWEGLAPEVDELRHITCLQICIRGWSESFKRASWIFARTPALRALDLELESVDDNGAEDCCELGEYLLLKVFGSVVRQPPKLKALRISRMCLKLAGDLLSKAVSLDELEHLQLIECRDVDPFLRKLEAFHLNLSSLCIERSERTHWSGLALRGFILSLGPPLKRLRLNCDDYEIITFDDLLKHAASIECLLIEVNDPEQPPLDAPFNRMFTRLEQLALSGHNIEDGHWQFEMEHRRDGVSGNLPRIFSLQVSV
jgi:hypothetical protein